ncbi:hypothetical protein CEXT_62801 [Caerostris extrusa]|uniref:Uncharacterized protein n=1 Tax=Caerostris extrusa TaxID=172846 RepID=A0AAV4PBJ7_CAEEX|nr:hypothetical protein CEXT_62801 [Caerostris extrusa]
MKPTFRADNLLSTLQWNRTIEIETMNHILRKFNPPTSSWWGDIKEIVMPDCDAADCKGFNIRIKYRRALQKILGKD